MQFFPRDYECHGILECNSKCLRTNVKYIRAENNELQFEYFYSNIVQEVEENKNIAVLKFWFVFNPRQPDINGSLVNIWILDSRVTTTMRLPVNNFTLHDTLANPRVPFSSTCNKQHFFIVSHLTPHARHLNGGEEAPDSYARSRIRHLHTGQRARVSFSPRSKGVPRFSIVIASLT